MRLTVKEREKATAIASPMHQKARKKDKGLILDEFRELTGKQYAKLNPARLKRQITRFQQKLIRLHTMKQAPKKNNAA